jgi:hypothetical protein
VDKSEGKKNKRWSRLFQLFLLAGAIATLVTAIIEHLPSPHSSPSATLPTTPPPTTSSPLVVVTAPPTVIPVSTTPPPSAAPAPAPSVTLAPDFGRIGSHIRVIGQGYTPGSDVQFSIFDDRTGQAVADADGRFNTVITVVDTDSLRIIQNFCPQQERFVAAEGGISADTVFTFEC